MSGCTPVPKGFVPDMLFSCVMRTIFIRFAIWLVVCGKLFVKIVVNGLVVEHSTHGKFRDQLWIVKACRRVKPTLRGSRMFNHRRQHLGTGHLTRPTVHNALVRFTRQIFAFGNLIERLLLDVEIALVNRRYDRFVVIRTAKISHHFSLQIGRIRTTIPFGGQLFQAVVQDVAGNLTGVRHRVSLAAAIAFDGHRKRTVRGVAIGSTCQCKWAQTRH